MAVTLDSLRKAVKKNKGRSQALAWLADMERASGDYEAALKIVDEALAASPSDVPAMLVRARILSGQQDFAGSISEYKKVLAKDPFCLAAHKRMGESYDKLGKEAERNACFRRVHDMDPLDPFWKDEYDVLTEEEQASLVAPPMDDSSFTMDVSDDSENAAGEDNIFANLAASLPNTDEEDNTSMEALRNSLNFASDENAGNIDGSEMPDFGGHVLNSSEVSSAISGILGGDDDLDVDDSSKTEESTSSLFSHFSDEEKTESEQEQKIEDIPDELIDEPLNIVSDDESENSELSLDNLDEPQAADENSTNVDDAFSSLLGEDELPEESSSESSVAEPAENAETNVDDAFSSLLGDDELPEETAADADENSTVEESAELTLDEPVAEEPTAEEPVIEESAVETSESEKVEEPVAEEAPAEESFGSLFEKSADADFSLNDELPAEESTDSITEEKIEEPAAEEPTAEETVIEESAVETSESEKVEEPVAEEASAEEESFGSLFEKSADADFSLNDDAPATSEPALEKAPEFVPTESAENIAPAEGLVPTSHMDFSDEEDLSSSDEDFVLNLDGDAPAELDDEKPVAEETVETPIAETSESETVEEPVADTLNDSFDLNDAVEEKVETAETAAVEESPVAEEESAVEEVDGAFEALFGDDSSETSTETDAAETSTETVDEAPATEPAQDASQDDLAKEMGGAFASMFGDDNDIALPEEKSEESSSQEATGAVIEEEAVKDDVKESVDESFDSIFGAGDDLPEENTEAPAESLEEPVAEQPVETATAAESPVETPAETLEEAPSAELDSIDSEVSNAFKGLFDEDDSLSESEEPSNKGVDYLMSGDSDDEVAASLVNDADAPLSRGAADLDDSLNTRTLADIYMEQGVYNKALEIYSDLAKKNPDDAEIKSRLEEIEKLCREKFGEV